VRRNIEEIVHRETQPLEANLVAIVVNIVRDCQETLSTAYRERAGSNRGASSPGTTQPVLSASTVEPVIQSQEVFPFRCPSEELQDRDENHARQFLETITSTPPSQQFEQFGPSISELSHNRPFGRPVGGPSIDSGYGGSLKRCSCGEICTCRSDLQEESFLTTGITFDSNQESEFFGLSDYPDLDALVHAGSGDEWWASSE
jgi:hypothetical protein